MTGLSCISTQFLDPFPQVAMIPEMGAGNWYESWGQGILHYETPGGFSYGLGEPRLDQTSTNVWR
jgi:hypothetical protein